MIGKTRSLIYSTNEAIHSFRSKSFVKRLIVHLPKSLGYLLRKVDAAAHRFKCFSEAHQAGHGGTEGLERSEMSS